ncbi:unnamed protein product [Rotaria sp. Silwood2]|nr:unnamed protein product [Rotaria sp. Silwood2]CAF2975300.1 unnamed protein product [Rotaria sp. Silwood2]CAF4199779.1 unnamed protein product [Rotaria sp. Silwood2]CAF4290424.1 unnamed protein product [Rotaria sp. Silwood2]CAF4305503.1 unnamed protein product [Rotaria sp. Silwood2]
MFLEPFDRIFQAECQTERNPRASLWSYADRTQRMKLEYWGYLLEINEWKNERKWSGDNDEDDDQKAMENVQKPSVISKRDETTIAIAFPLKGITENSTSTFPTQPIFAYLPLRSCGFRFILQADFEIPASRQDLRRDNLWNEWLKSKMPQLMYLAYQQFKQLPELIADLNLMNEHYAPPTAIQAIKFFLKFLPASYEIDPYFQLFVNRSFELLAGVVELPVINMRLNGNKEIIWVPPPQNSYYLHDEVVDECNEKLLVALGCRILNVADILQLIESSYRSVDQEYPKNEATIKQGENR